jgi:hypothetical protein
MLDRSEENETKEQRNYDSDDPLHCLSAGYYFAVGAGELHLMLVR